MSHNCHYLVLTCIDFRFRLIQQPLLNKLKECDRVAMAGSSKAVVDLDTREAAIKQLKLSHQLHGMSTIYIVDHEDCGAFGGKDAFELDEQEIAYHLDTAAQAKIIIEKELPGLEVKAKFAKLNGEIIDLDI